MDEGEGEHDHCATLFAGFHAWSVAVVSCDILLPCNIHVRLSVVQDSLCVGHG